ncbi:MAG: hypothetical protein WCJ64_07010 [Rhodospirillaceae bacterium]
MISAQRLEYSKAQNRAASNPNTTREAIDMVISCYVDFVNCATPAQGAHVIEGKLRALIMAIEQSFQDFNNNIPDVPTSVMATMRTARGQLLDNLHNDLNVIKFGINPLPSVIKILKVWVTLCRAIGSYAQPDDQCAILMADIP